jgi:hypothetical protein
MRLSLKKTLKRLFLTLVVLAALTISSPFWLSLIFRDGPVPDTSDLQFTWELPENNAYDTLILLNDYQDIEDEDLTQEQKNEILTILDEAALADAYLEPLLATDYHYLDIITPSLFGFNRAIELSVERANLYFEVDGTEPGKDELLRALVIMNMMEEAPGNGIQWLIAISNKPLVYQALIDNEIKIPQELISDYELNRIQILKFEFMWAEAVLQDLKETAEEVGGEAFEMGMQTPYHFHPNDTLAQTAEYYRAIIEKEKISCDQENEQLKYHYEYFDSPLSFFIKNHLGKVYMSHILPSFYTQDRKCELEELEAQLIHT